MTIAVWIEGTVMKISLQVSSHCVFTVFAQMPCPLWLLSACGGHSHMKCDCIVNRSRVALSEYRDYTRVFCIAHIKLLHPSDISFIPPFTRDFFFMLPCCYCEFLKDQSELSISYRSAIVTIKGTRSDLAGQYFVCPLVVHQLLHCLSQSANVI